MQMINKDEIKISLSSLGVILLYFIASWYQALPLQLLGIDYEKWNQIYKLIYSLSYELILIGIIIAIFRTTLVNAYYDLKANHKKYFKEYAKYWILMIAIMIFSNGIITLITSQSEPANEELIREMFSAYPIYTFISAIILAPILEELVFRQAFRNVFPTNILYIITSSLVFGGLHVLTGYENWTDLLYLIPYCTPGVIFAYIMTKTNNIFVTMSMHLFHNGITMSLLILVKLLT